MLWYPYFLFLETLKQFIKLLYTRLTISTPLPTPTYWLRQNQGQPLSYLRNGHQGKPQACRAAALRSGVRPACIFALPWLFKSFTPSLPQIKHKQENPKGSRDNFTKPPRQMGYKFYHKRQMRRRWIYIGKGFRSSGSERVSMENPSRRQLDIASPSGCKLNSSHHLRLSLTSFVRNLGPFPLALGCASILLFK